MIITAQELKHNVSIMGNPEKTTQQEIEHLDKVIDNINEAKTYLFKIRHWEQMRESFKVLRKMYKGTMFNENYIHYDNLVKMWETRIARAKFLYKMNKWRIKY